MKKQVYFQMLLDQKETSFHTKGMLVGHKLTFLDQEGVKNSIVWDQKQIEYFKSGEKNMHYIFEEGKTTSGVYELENFSFHFKIETTYVEKTEERIVIHFTLKQEHDLIGHHELLIELKDDEEE